MIEMEPLVFLEPGTIGRHLGFSNALRTGTPERFFCHLIPLKSFIVPSLSLNLFSLPFAPAEDIAPGAIVAGQPGIDSHIESRGVETFVTGQVQGGVSNVFRGACPFEP